jgi:ElaB/YqjD/DUF883 family membrane-anchored ribosome-binding protein
MSLEKFNNTSADNFDKLDSTPEAALLPKERELKLQKEVKESYLKLKKLMQEFGYLSEEDYFETREKLQSVLNNIQDVKTEQQILSDKLEEVIKVKDEFSVESLQEQLNNEEASKN